MKRLQLTTLILLLSVFLNSAVQVPEYGLYIQTYPERRTNFTSIILDGGDFIDISGKETTLSFKIWNRSDNIFGTIFRIITDKGQNIDLMYSVNETERHHPILVFGNDIHPINREIRHNTWMDVQLTISPHKKMVSLSYDNQLVSIQHPDIKKIEQIRVALGYCPFENYQLENVASVNLKDIHLYLNGKTIRQWDLASHRNDTCFDVIAHRPAVGKDTRWLMDEHFTWKKIYHHEFNRSPYIAFAQDSGKFYILAQPNELREFQPACNQETILPIKGNGFVSSYPNQLHYVPQGHKLLSCNWDEGLFSFLDIKTRQWDNAKRPSRIHKQHYWNSSQTYISQDSSLISFGGYGHFLYNNDLLTKKCFSTDTSLKKQKLTSIHPRFSAASTVVDSMLYIFGGYGCPSGNSVLSPKFYYDLYAIHLGSGQTNLLWELPGTPEGGAFLPGENLVYDETRDCFYCFSTQQGGTLLKIDRQRPIIEQMSFPLHQKLEARFIYTNLYHSPQQAKIYAVIHQTYQDTEAQLDIFELDYPSISIQHAKQAMMPIREKRSFIYWGIGVLSISLFSGLIVFFLRKRQQSQPEPLRKSIIPNDMTQEIQAYSSYIHILGRFQVTDKEGNDITDNFTPTLKSLLILLILHTAKDAKGISSRQLIQTLWPEKSESSAKNNCYVHISKLRNILNKMGEITIQNKASYWSILFKDDCVCDYIEVSRLYYTEDNKKLEKMLDLLLRGMMLPDLENEWVDKFKNEFSSHTINLLCQVLKKSDLPDELSLKIAETLFQHDYLNEEALAEKCNILYRQGKKGLAITVYEAFCKEYESSLGIPYTTPLTTLIKETGL